MGHSVSDAASRSVKKSETNRLAERTPEQIMVDVRNNAASGLFVVPSDVRFLIAELDAASAKLTAANATIQSLTEQNEEFRRVYEMENSSQSLKIERVPIQVPTESGA